MDVSEMNFARLNTLGVDCPPGQMWELITHRCIPDPNYVPPHHGIGPGPGVVVIDPRLPGINPESYGPPVLVDDSGMVVTNSAAGSENIFGVPPVGWAAIILAAIYLIKK